MSITITIKNFNSWVATFDGDSTINAEEWLRTLRMETELMEIDDNQKLMFLVQTRLRDKATIWWVSEKNAYYDKEGNTEQKKLPSLEVFVAAFKKEYMGSDERRRWLQKFCG